MTEQPQSADPRTTAHIAPLAVFMGLLMLPDVLSTVGITSSEESAVWWRRQPELWVYPVQTIVTLLVLAVNRRHYEFRPVRGIGLAVVGGTVGIAAWIAPGLLFEQLNMSAGPLSYLGFTSRAGEYPAFLVSQEQPALYWLTVVMRFVRLVIAVPLAEEIFWRGFLMRFVADPDGNYWNIPFGTFHRRSLLIVTAVFVLIHSPADYLGAAIFGTMMYALAVRTKSLTACVLMHAVANLLLGFYVMQTQQWGYW